MSKKRMVHDSFFQSEGVALWTMRQRLLVIGMISVADDQGRLKGNVLWLRAQIFPYDMVSPDEIATDLATIASSNDTIMLYQVNGRSYIQLIHWWDYQTLQWAKASEFPPPDDWQDCVRQMVYTPKRWIMTYNWPNTPDKLSFEEGNEGGDLLGNALPNKLANALPIINTNTNIKEGGRLKAKSNGEKPTPAEIDMVNAIVDVTNYSGHLNWLLVYSLAQELIAAGFTSSDVLTAYSKGGPWFTTDWRGKKGDKPTDKAIRETISGLCRTTEKGKTLIAIFDEEGKNAGYTEI